MYERSLEVEPREREDEKIARYATGGRDMSSLTFGTLLMSSRWFFILPFSRPFPPYPPSYRAQNLPSIYFLGDTHTFYFPTFPQKWPMFMDDSGLIRRLTEYSFCYVDFSLNRDSCKRQTRFAWHGATLSTLTGRQRFETRDNRKWLRYGQPIKFPSGIRWSRLISALDTGRLPRVKHCSFIGRLERIFHDSINCIFTWCRSIFAILRTNGANLSCGPHLGRSTQLTHQVGDINHVHCHPMVVRGYTRHECASLCPAKAELLFVLQLIFE